MTYNEASKLADQLTRELGSYVQIDENDNTIQIEGWISFDEVRWLAMMLPLVEKQEEVGDEA